jgi:hypothetical protein
MRAEGRLLSFSFLAIVLIRPGSPGERKIKRKRNENDSPPLAKVISDLRDTAVDSPPLDPIASRLSRARARSFFLTQNTHTWP